MPTVLRAHGLRFMILTDDHPPPHVHVYGDGEAKIEIGDHQTAPRMLYAVEMTRTVQRRAVRITAANCAHLPAKWAEIHG